MASATKHVDVKLVLEQASDLRYRSDTIAKKTQRKVDRMKKRIDIRKAGEKRYLATLMELKIHNTKRNNQMKKELQHLYDDFKRAYDFMNNQHCRIENEQDKLERHLQRDFP